jgi:hypothetical protein
MAGFFFYTFSSLHYFLTKQGYNIHHPKRIWGEISSDKLINYEVVECKLIQSSIKTIQPFQGCGFR